MTKLLMSLVLVAVFTVPVYAEPSEELGVYFTNIEELLAEADTEYSSGSTDTAMNNVIKAYLDNFENLEYDIEQHNEELMKRIETNLRQHLRDMIRNSEPSEDVSAYITMILVDLGEAKKLVLPIVSEDKTSMESSVMNKDEPRTKGDPDMRPLQQIDVGVIPKDVACKSGFELILKANDENPACVTQKTAQILIARGWGISS